MRRVGLVLGLAGLLGAVLATIAGPAVAGGPTSVLLVAPDTGRAAALHVTNPAYEELVHATDSGPRTAKSPEPTGEAIRLTWLIHDVQVWRIDEVYVDAPGGPWIATRQTWDGDPLRLEPVWHRSAQPKQLVDLLTRLKVRDPKAPPVEYPATMPAEPAPAPGDTATTDASGVSGDDAQAAGVQAEASSPQSQRTDHGWVAISGWRWALLGLLAGIGLTYLTVRLSAGWQRRVPDPHVELIDETEPSQR